MEQTVQVQLKKPWQGYPVNSSVEVTQETAKDLVAKGIAAWIPPTGEEV